ncbi:MAG: heavy metal translocating P-type ATPase [Clostridiales bacterium]|nr:heavy metal translocating P-type ATPase [Clostridiales bacterium]
MKEFNVTGMSCAACSAAVERAVSSVAGVTGVNVSLLTNSMTVDGSAADNEIISAVKSAGYGASPKGAAAEKNSAALASGEMKGMVKRLVASVVFLLPLMYISMGHMMFSWPVIPALQSNHLALGLIQMLLTIIIMVINQKFFINGFKGIIHKAPNMDSLVALGSGAAFIYSTVVLFLMTAYYENMASYHNEMYFESAAMILTLITVGKTLESYSKGKATTAVNSLMSLAPDNATVIRNGKEITLKASDLTVGDIFIVKPGEAMPCDGVIIEGSAAVDESALTGESIPVDKTAGDNVSTATINQSGFIKCRATKVGKDTSLAAIIKMVTDAAATKAPIAKIADKVSGIFVPAVIAIAAITIISWLIAGQETGFALARGISVLVISCPCALGLATPVAIMVGSGKAAKNGILFKTAESLENTGKADIICFDKTGTITMGETFLTDIIAPNREKLLSVAYSLEQKSEHPLALAVVNFCSENAVEAHETKAFKTLPGNGLQAQIGEKLAVGGNLSFVQQFAAVPADYVERANSLASAGKTPLFFAIGSEFLGVIAVADKIKDTSAKAIKAIKKLGLSVVMITGDNEKTARSIACEAGIDNVIAKVLPNEKEAKVKQLFNYGRVAMVGDGINDAPALTRADTGIAIGAGTDIAIDAADVVLMKDDLTDVPKALILSKKVLRNIKENLFWAFFYNIIGIPVAAGILYPAFEITLNPMIAAAAMSLSSFCVVSNALRLNAVSLEKYKSKKTKNKEIDMTVFENNKAKKQIIIDGMMCEHCEMHVTKALAEIGLKVTANHKENAAVIESGSADEESIKKAVTEAGYKFVGVKDC